MSNGTLDVLVVEDNPADAELMLRELRRAGFGPDWRRVETEHDFLAALEPTLDIILSDYAMPGFSGLRALELARERRPDIPFILVSGSIGEETAVAAMRAGAADYLLKDRLTRLGAAVEHALEEKRIRAESKRTQVVFETLRRDYELILNTAGDGICGIDIDGRISFANPKAAALLGCKPEELLGTAIHPFIANSPSGTKAPKKNAIADCLEEGGTRRVTNELFQDKDGRSFRADYVCAPMKDKRGHVAGTILTFQDVTERFTGDLRMQLQAQQYRLLFETNPNPMWVFATKNSQILAVNQSAIALYGYSREEFVGLRVEELWSRETVPELKRAEPPSSVQQKSHFTSQSRHIRKDGSAIFVENYSSAIVWDGVAARMVTAIDTTERKKAEQRLREQAEIIDLANDAIIIRNFEDYRILFWNKGAERLFGWSAEERVGRANVTALAEPRQMEMIMSTLRSAGEFRGELKLITRDGKELICDVRESLVRTPDGTPRSILIICSDITEQKKLEMQLLRAQRLESIGTLASGVAHDLNNVLTPILMCAEVLRRNPTGEDSQSAIQLIGESARRGAAVVKQVLTFARGVEGERVVIKPSHLVDEMIDIARVTFSKAIEITGRYSDELWSIEGDPTQLHQVLLNLAVNSRDAISAHRSATHSLGGDAPAGSLVIAAANYNVDQEYAAMTPGANPGPHVVLSVSDNGQGMSRATLEKIFDPFFTTKEVGKGTGLGLSTVMGIVKSHGGFISIQSEMGRGTMFKVFLPAKVDGVAGLSGERPLEPLTGNGETILVVDDETGILQVTKTILQQSNYQVICAADGTEALAAFAGQMHSVNAVLTDLELPYMGGLALIRAAKKMKPDLVFIASSGHDENGPFSELKELGVTNFLPKPYDSATLLAALRDALSPLAK